MNKPTSQLIRYTIYQPTTPCRLPSHRRHAEAGPRKRGPAALVVVAAAAQPVPVRLGRRLRIQRLAPPESEPPPPQEPPPEGHPVLQRRQRQRERGFRVGLWRRPRAPGEERRPEAPGRHRGPDRGVHGEEGAEEGIEIEWWSWGESPFGWAGIRVALRGLEFLTHCRWWRLCRLRRWPRS